jgi:hypothetical protein
MNEQWVLTPEVAIGQRRKGAVAFLPRLVRAVLQEAARRRARPTDDDLESALCRLQAERRLAELHTSVGVSLIGYEVDPFQLVGR